MRCKSCGCGRGHSLSCVVVLEVIERFMLEIGVPRNWEGTVELRQFLLKFVVRALGSGT